jgi:hypothetical protein
MVWRANQTLCGVRRYARVDPHFCSGRSRCSPGGSSAYSPRCSGWSGVETACSSPSHFPKSINLHRCEQNGPYPPLSQSPSFLQVGHLIAFFILPDVPHPSRPPCTICLLQLPHLRRSYAFSALRLSEISTAFFRSNPFS